MVEDKTNSFQNRGHETSKEDDDPILQFSNIDIAHLVSPTIKLKGIKFFDASNDELIALTMNRIEHMRGSDAKFKGIQHVMPLDPYRFTRVHMSKEKLKIANKSFINLPSAAGMEFMGRMMNKPLPAYTPTVHYIMSLIHLAQAKEYTVFIVGSEDKTLEKLHFNLKRSFPRLRLVGRHHGYFRGDDENKVVQALRKTDPHIILLGLGTNRELKWISKYRQKVGSSLLVNVGGALDIMAGRRKKAPDFIVTHGLTWLWRSFKHPYRLFFILQWYLNCVFYRIFKVKKKK